MLDGELTIPLGSNGEPQRLPAGSLRDRAAARRRTPSSSNAATMRASSNFHAPGVGFAAMIRASRQREAAVRPEHPPPADGGRPGTDATIGRGVLLVDEPVLRMALLADEEQLAVSEVMSAAGVASTRRICTAATRSRSMSSPVSSC